MNHCDALDLLQEYTKNPSLIKHALAVEAAMRAYARLYGEDEERWGIVGLLHDFDYELHPTPDEHPEKGAAILSQLGYPEDVIYAIRSHGDHLGIERKSLMDKALYAVDELCGFVVAVALVRPSKSLAEVDVSAVTRKMKQKGFAAAVSREGITRGAADLGVDLDEHIARVISAMQAVATELGLG